MLARERVRATSLKYRDIFGLCAGFCARWVLHEPLGSRRAATTWWRAQAVFGRSLEHAAEQLRISKRLAHVAVLNKVDMTALGRYDNYGASYHYGEHGDRVKLPH
jgi:hypothetical protein